MTFYVRINEKHVPGWICQACDTVNSNSVTVCVNCLNDRDDVAIQKPNNCTCIAYAGDDLRCEVHGVALSEPE